MNSNEDATIPADRWIGNLLEAAELIANREYQETRWLAADAFAWESPDEAINARDDCVLDAFIEQFAESFSPAQVEAVIAFRTKLVTTVERPHSISNQGTYLATRRWK